MKTIDETRNYIANNKFDCDTACYIAGYCRAIFGENNIFVTFATDGEIVTGIPQFIKWFENE